MIVVRAALVAIILGIAVPLAAEPADPYAITPTERAACIGDAERFCAATYPDERALLACMKDKRASLSPGCRSVLDAGLKRRGL